MEAIATEFKTEANRILDFVIEKLKVYPGQDLPIGAGTIEGARGLFLGSLDGDCYIKIFTEDSFHCWDAIYDRDEESLIRTFKEEVSDRAPMFSKMATSILEFVLARRRDLVTEEEEDQVWKDTGNLIRLAIQYAHLRRAPKFNSDGERKYTVRYVPKLSVKSAAEKWGVSLE